MGAALSVATRGVVAVPSANALGGRPLGLGSVAGGALAGVLVFGVDSGLVFLATGAMVARLLPGVALTTGRDMEIGRAHV